MHTVSSSEDHAQTAAETLNVADLSCLAEQVTDHLPFDADMPAVQALPLPL